MLAAGAGAGVAAVAVAAARDGRSVGAGIASVTSGDGDIVNGGVVGVGVAWAQIPAQKKHSDVPRTQ